VIRSVDIELVRASREARKGLHELGPGLVTGVADDDPSGISTYTVAGAAHGYQLLWTSLVTLPMNFAVQVICARIGLVTGHGLAEIVAERYGRRWLAWVVGLLAIANIVNIGADIGAIAAAIELLVPIPAAVVVVPVGLAIALAEVAMPYAQFARYLKILTLVIFAYVVGAFFAGPDWGAAARATVWPTVDLDRDSVATVVAILGTTISPYLFFWQASEEVEEEQEHGVVAANAPAAVRALVRAANFDVGVGMLIANIGFYFVVLTSAAALHAGGITEVTTAAEAAEALRPLAGDGASILFALGIIGTGLLAVPVLAGSLAYATSELMGWPEGLNQPLRRAPQFYGVIALATVLGVGIVFSPVSEIQALFVAAIINGITAPVLLVFVMLVARDRRLLGEATPGRAIRWAGWATTGAMALAAIALFVILAGV
jgi:NRAMP (natural resistance-associated macrophage protein)-like metal ion transporter